MIVQGPMASSAAPPVAIIAEERSVSSRMFHGSAGNEPPSPSSEFTSSTVGETLELQPTPCPVREKFDWANARLNREFIRLEQKVLAQKASPSETERYNLMRHSRNSHIFGDRYLRDYAEIRRLRKLSEKLAEIQQYLRPIQL